MYRLQKIFKIDFRNDKNITYLLYLCWALSIPWSVFLMQIFLGFIVLYTIVINSYNKKPFVVLDSFLIYILIYLAIRLLSAFFSPNISKSLISILDNEWVIASIFFLGTNAISRENRQKIFIVLILSSFIAGLYGILQGFTGINLITGKDLNPFGNFYRATGGYGFYLSFAGNQMMVVFITIGMLVITKKTEKLRRMFYLIVLMVLLGSIMLTFARSTWLALILFFTLIGLLVNLRLFLRAIVPIIILIALIVYLSPDLQDRFMSIFELSRNETRINLWKTSLAMIKDKPIFGIGPGMFKELIPLYKVPGYYDTIVHSHNDFIYVAAISGIPALISWLSIWFAWLCYFRKCLKKGEGIKINRDFLTYITFAIGSILFAGLFQCYYTDLENNIMWIFIFIKGYHILRESNVFSNSPRDLGVRSAYTDFR